MRFLFFLFFWVLNQWVCELRLQTLGCFLRQSLLPFAGIDCFMLTFSRVKAFVCLLLYHRVTIATLLIESTRLFLSYACCFSRFAALTELRLAETLRTLVSLVIDALHGSLLLKRNVKTDACPSLAQIRVHSVPSSAALLILTLAPRVLLSAAQVISTFGLALASGGLHFLAADFLLGAVLAHRNSSLGLLRKRGILLLAARVDIGLNIARVAALSLLEVGESSLRAAQEIVQIHFFILIAVV